LPRLKEVNLDETGLPVRTPEVEQERNVAIFDLLEENQFALPQRDDINVPEGPFILNIAVKDRRLVFDIKTDNGEDAAAFHLSLSPFRQIIKEYFQICEQYFSAIKTHSAAQIEAIDMGRRGLHDEGSRILLERLTGKVETNHQTARRLFTLICVLHFKG